ncbi:MAG: tandem-95 repeat protein [Pseudomonadota bacterium]
MATRIGMSGPGDSDLLLRVGADGAPVTVPDAHFLFTAEFDRAGSDLVLSNESGQTVRIMEYFSAASPVDLAAPNGALLKASVVEALAGPLAPAQYVQAGATTGAAPIGQVETLEGSATVQRTDGTRVNLKIGDPVFQGDVVQSGADSKLGITFIDKTIFTLSDEARMVLDELVYSPGGSDNSMLINLVQGTFVFVAGGVAPSGDMKVQTPVATMGIRGTTIITKVSAVDGTSTLSLDVDPGGDTGLYQIIDTASGLVLATVTRTGENWVISPPSEPGQPPNILTTPKNDSELFNDQEALQFLYQTFQAASARFANSPDGDGNANPQSTGPSSVPGSGVDSGVDPNALDPLDPGFTPNTGEQDGAPQGEPEQPETPPDTLLDNSDDQSSAPREAPTSEGAFVSTDEDTPSDGIEVPVEGAQPDETVEVTITELPVRGLLLLDGEEVAVGDVLPIEDTELLTFSPNGEFEELTAQDLELLQFSYTVGFPGGPTSEPVVAVISVPGVNDDPIAVNETADGGENETLTIDVLANDTDVDRNDDPSNFLLTQANILSEGGGSVQIVNNQLVFDPGTDFDGLTEGQSAEVQVQYTMTDDEGAASTAEVQITVNGENDAPLAVDDTAGGGENQTLTIDVLNNDTDVDDTDGPGTFELTQASILSVTGDVQTGGSVQIVNDQLVFDPGTDFDTLGSGQSAEVRVAYTMVDGQGTPSSAEVVITVDGQNDGPVAVNETAGGTENQLLTIDVLANDTDADSTDSPSNFLLTQVSILSVAGAVLTDASVSIANNKLVFNPGTNFDALGANDSADVTVQYTMTDDEGAPSTGQVVITVAGENDPPAAQQQILETETNSEASGQLQAQDVDAGDALTFAATSNGPSNGEVTILPDGAFTYIPDEAFQGFDAFEFQVTDLEGDTSTATVIVEVASENFTNPNGQTITFGIDGESPLSSGIGIANVEIDVSEVSGAFINVSFVFDASGSLGSSAYAQQMAAIQTAINDMRTQFANSQTQIDIQLVRFASVTTTVEHDLYAPALDNVAGLLPFTGGGTNFDDALAEAEDFFNGELSGEQNFLFFTSDGQPFGSSATNPPWQTTAQNLQNAGVIISAFGIGPNISPATLNQIDNTGGSENVNQASDLSDAFSGTPIFAAELVAFSLNLVADGVNQGEIADKTDLQDDGVNSDLPLADVAGLADLLGEDNQFTATATFDFDGSLGTTGDQITLFSAETISASAEPVSKTGTTGNDLLLGGFQDDTIDGEGGQDILLGFSGNDILEVSDATFHKVDGGSGQDTLVLDGTDLDLTSFNLSKLASIERIDLKDANADTLTLDFNAVMGLSETVNTELNTILEGFFGVGNAPAHSLVVDGGASDTVELVDDASGFWTELTGPAFAGYDIYAFESAGGAVLAAVAIDDDVAVPPATA